MDITQLKYFSAIAKTGSMSRAAELLNISQPALSKVTRLLQEELGYDLIRHVGRQIILTEQGRRFVENADVIIQQFDNLKLDVACRAEMECEEVRIATFEVFSTYALQYLEKIEWQQKRLAFHECIPGELENAIANKHADLGITYIPVPHPELEHLKVATIDMGTFTHKEAFKGMKQPDIPFVVPAMPLGGAPTRVRGLDGWPEDAYQRKVKYRVTLLETAFELCRQGLAAGYFPLFVVELHNQRVDPAFRLVRRPSIYTGRRCMQDVFIVKRKADIENKNLKQLAKGLRLICNQ